MHVACGSSYHDHASRPHRSLPLIPWELSHLHLQREDITCTSAAKRAFRLHTRAGAQAERGARTGSQGDSRLAAAGCIWSRARAVAVGPNVQHLACRDAGKAVKSLIAAGMLDGSPDAVAGWIREHQAALDATQIGEFLGSHEDLPVGTRACDALQLEIKTKGLGLVDWA